MTKCPVGGWKNVTSSGFASAAPKFPWASTARAMNVFRPGERRREGELREERREAGRRDARDAGRNDPVTRIALDAQGDGRGSGIHFARACPRGRTWKHDR